MRAFCNIDNLPTWKICKGLLVSFIGIKARCKGFVWTSKNVIFKDNSKLVIALLLRLWLFIIYVWVVYLRYIADKKLPSLHLLSPSISTPLSCVLTTSIFLSFLSKAGPDSPNWRELLALLQTVCQLQCRVYGGKSEFLCGWAGIFLMPSCCLLFMISVIWSVLCKLYFLYKSFLFTKKCHEPRHTYLTNHTL